jgi:hypothetical protein
MKIKTNQLTGAALDWAVAKCQFPYASSEDIQVWVQPLPCDDETDFKFQPSTDWAQGGPIIEREGIWLQSEVGKEETASAWYAVSMDGHDAYGPTPLIAAMRCYVTSKLGDEVEIPEEITP